MSFVHSAPKFASNEGVRDALRRMLTLAPEPRQCHGIAAALPRMQSQGSGHIINVGSIAGKEVYANGNVYCATKHAVDALTRSMLIDLNPYGIKVGSINPGMVETEFSVVRFKGDEERAKKVYEGLQPLTAKDVAEVIGFMATLPPHVNISDLTLLPTAQGAATVVKRG